MTSFLRLSSLALVLVVWSGCSGQPTLPPFVKTPSSSTNSTVSNTTNPPGDMASTGSSATTDQCLQGCAVLAGNGGLLSKENCEGGCWASYAKEKKDVQVCLDKISKENAALMFSGCIIGVAEETGDYSACDKIGSSSEDFMVAGCYTSAAKKANDPSICDKIANTLMATGCKSDLQSQ